MALSKPTYCGGVMVRSENSGGLATGLTYNPEDDQVLIVGTTFEKSFWGMGLPSENGECFVALGDITHEKPEFTRMAVPTPAVCFGGTSIVPHSDKGGLSVASILGMTLQGEDIGFLATILYYMGQLAVSSNPPTLLPNGLLPVASSREWGNSTSLFVGLHPIDTGATPFGFASTDETQTVNRLQSLMHYWWHSTNPSQEGLITSAPTNLVRGPPHVRKHDVFTGDLAFDVSLDMPLRSTALIATVLHPASPSSTEKQPLLVIGSTNAPDVAKSLFGQNTNPKLEDQTDWDAYILFLDADSGAVFRDPVVGNETDTRRPAIRINSIGDADDFIHGACVSPDLRYLYVVGTTQGIIEGIHKGGAFLIQYDMSTWEMQWQYQQTGLQTEGLSCIADDEAVYLAGSTESNLKASSPLEVSLSPDAFVTKVTTTGQHLWTEILDTTVQENGDLRREIIVGMQVTATGQVMVLMNSMNLDGGSNDIFLLDLDPSTGRSNLDEALENPSRFSTFSTKTITEVKDNTVLVMAILIPILVALCLFSLPVWRNRSRVERSTTNGHKPYTDTEEIEEALSQLEKSGASVV